MEEAVIQYVLILLLVVGLTYLVYLLKDKGVNIKEDYFGIAFTLLNFLEKDEATNENIKKILRAISSAVNFVESNYKFEANEIKEDKALTLIKNSLKVFNLKSVINDDTIRSIIRIACALLPPTK